VSEKGKSNIGKSGIAFTSTAGTTSEAPASTVGPVAPGLLLLLPQATMPEIGRTNQMAFFLACID
jgi:hypothetical protein